jgi:hypothetical protein
MLSSLFLVLGIIQVHTGTVHASSNTVSLSPVLVWGTKPVLPYFVLNAEHAQAIKTRLRLTDADFELLRSIAVTEAERLRRHQQASETMIENPRLSLAQKQDQIEASGYNQQVLNIVESSEVSLATALDPQKYTALVHWIEQQWVIDQQKYGTAQESDGGRTFTVFATQYAPNTANAFEVAIPDKCIKFANLAWSLTGCPTGMYSKGKNYSVTIVHKDYVVKSVPVLEVGPWNIDDNYWTIAGDSQYRRRFSDLPMGMPQAQAAFFNGYNGGKDQYGRIVANPAGIDLTDPVRRQLGLGYLQNAWVQVTFSWLENFVFLPAIPHS